MSHHPHINRTMQRAFASCVEEAMSALRKRGTVQSDEQENAIIDAIGEQIANHNEQPAGGWDNWFWRKQDA